MEPYVYLIQNGDLYNIGTSSNIERAKEILRPGTICAYLKTKQASTLSNSLQSRYSDVRLPGSDYFRLTNSQLLECKLIMKSEGSNSYFEPIFKGRTLFVLFILSWIFISSVIIKLGVDPIIARFL